MSVTYFQIKGSFYSLLGALCQSNAVLANQYADKICPAVLHNLDESDPTVCPSLWEAVLYTISTTEVNLSSYEQNMIFMIISEYQICRDIYKC